MKKILFILVSAIAVLASACASDDHDWVIKGTTTQDRLNGQLVFLVPCNPNSMMFTDKVFEDSIGVDSVRIIDGKFEFRGKGEYLARITMHKNVRYGTQDMLVVTEPGCEISVVIDSVSSGAGSPQNDVMQRWKDLKIEHDAVVWYQTNHRKELEQTGETAYANSLADSIKTYNENFRKQMVNMGKALGHGPAYELLMFRYEIPDTLANGKQPAK